MKVLVTGAAGFVGSHLVDLLLSRNADVTCLVRKSSSLKWLSNKKINFQYCDLNDSDELKASIKDFDIIYHIAGRTFGSNYDEFHYANADATKNLLNAAYENIPDLKRFIYLSSQTVGGPSPTIDNPLNENVGPEPITSYGKSKLAGEKEVLKFSAKIPYTILRAPAIYGERDFAILPVFQSVKFGIGTLMGFNEKYISLLHIDDVVRGIYDASQSDNTINQIYYLSSDNFYSWKEIITIMQEKLKKKHVLFIRLPHLLILFIAKLSEIAGNLRGKPPVFNYEKGIDFIQNYWTASADKAKKDFNFKHLISAEQGIEKTIDWYKKNNLL